MIAFIYKPIYDNPYKFTTNGSFWYILEYFLKTYELNEQTEFIFISNKNFNLNILKDCLEFKYIVNIPLNNIKILSYYELINHIKYISIVTLDIETYSDEFIEKILKNKYICLLYTSNYKELIKDRYFKENIFHFAEGNTYIKKIYLDALKKPIKIKESVYVNLRGKRIVSIDQFNEKIKPVLDKINKGKLILIDNNNSMFSRYLKYLGIETFDQMLFDIHNQFDTYIDCALNVFDYSPRMILESYYFGKDVIYIDNNLNDGAKKRYLDIKNGNINKYMLNSDDELIRTCLKYV